MQKIDNLLKFLLLYLEYSVLALYLELDDTSQETPATMKEKPNFLVELKAKMYYSLKMMAIKFQKIWTSRKYSGTPAKYTNILRQIQKGRR